MENDLVTLHQEVHDAFHALEKIEHTLPVEVRRLISEAETATIFYYVALKRELEKLRREGR